MVLHWYRDSMMLSSLGSPVFPLDCPWLLLHGLGLATLLSDSYSYSRQEEKEGQIAKAHGT